LLFGLVSASLFGWALMSPLLLQLTPDKFAVAPLQRSGMKFHAIDPESSSNKAILGATGDCDVKGFWSIATEPCALGSRQTLHSVMNTAKKFFKRA
jgi:hypothetical protein